KAGAPAGVIDNTRFFFPVELIRRIDRMFRPEGQLYVATPAVLGYLGIDPATIDRNADFLVDRRIRTDGLSVTSPVTKLSVPLTNVERIEVGRHLSGSGSESARTPPSFITLAGLRRHGWKQTPAGWLVESSRPLTSDEIAGARRVAADAGLTIEVE